MIEQLYFLSCSDTESFRAQVDLRFFSSIKSIYYDNYIQEIMLDIHFLVHMNINNANMLLNKLICSESL